MQARPSKHWCRCPSPDPASARRGSIWALIGPWVRALTLVGLVGLVGSAPGEARAQNALIEALESGASAGGDRASDDPARSESSGDPMLAIEKKLAEARRRLSALEQAREAEGDAAPGSTALELAARLVRVLEERREARVQTEALALGREAIDSGLARDPSEIVVDPPPFPVPTLDGVRQAFRQALEQENQHKTLLEDRRANLRLAEEQAEDLDRQRRRLREVLEKQDDAVERVRLEAELRGLEDRLGIARQEVALSAQRVANTTIESEIRESSTRQARAALTWVESQLAPREADLTDAIERIDRQRLTLERELDLARSRLASAEATLRAAEEQGSGVGDEERADHVFELETRRAQLSYRQTIVALLNDRIERLGRMRTTWKHRYAVLGDRLDLDEAPAWRNRAESELERLTRLRRIHETELAAARLELANLLRAAIEPHPRVPIAARMIDLEFDDLEQLVEQYQSELASIESAIELEERLRAELLARMKDRDLGERLQSFWASAKAFWSFELTTSEDSPITPGKLLIALGVFVLGIWVARTVRRLTSRRLFPRLGFDAGASSAFASLAFYALLAAVFLLALRAVDIPLTAFAVAGGALAIGVGFGSQTMISNFISGLLLLAERPIRTGDLIEVGGVVGTVESIGLRSTRIRTPDNFHIIVPNASFLESNVINWTHEDPVLRLRVAVGVAYGSPVRRVEELLVTAATEHPRSLANPTPVAVFQDFGDSALLFEVRFWIRYDERTDRSRIQSDLRFRINELFAENGIVIAFPQIDVHFDPIASRESASDRMQSTDRQA